ncbi:MAG: S41 family peptidase [Bacillota bacterium]|nr:S41 family peptidase [Bacillota bacterium]
MVKHKLYIIIAVITFILSFFIFFIVKNVSKDSFSSDKQLTQKQKLEDFEYMYNILKENYPFFELDKSGYNVDWLSSKNIYIDKIKSTKSDSEFYSVLDNILKDLNDGHTNILDASTFAEYKTYFETDKNLASWNKQLSDKKAIARYKYGDSKESCKTNEAIDEFYKGNNFSTQILVQEKVAYLSLNSFNYSNLDKDMKSIKPFLNKIKDYEKLIIDIRGNPGGSDYFWRSNIVPMLIEKPLSYNSYCLFRGGKFEESFIEDSFKLNYKTLLPIANLNRENLKKLPAEAKTDFKYYMKCEDTIYPNKPVGFKGKIYLMVDKYVYSSAEGFAFMAKNSGFATLIGDRTGGGLSNQPVLCVLPNSGFVFRFSMAMGLDSDGTCVNEFTTKPDIYMPTPKESDLMEDKAIQYIINH